jgi:putative ABC transport system permease protein
MDWSVALPTLVGVSALVAIAAIVLRLYRVKQWYAGALAILRAALQLAALSLVLTIVIEDLLWVWLALGVMLVAAILTAGRRLHADWRMLLTLTVTMALAVVVTLGVIFMSGALELTSQYLLAIGGIVVGNTMAITTMTGRRHSSSVVARREEVEGWLALGATPRQSTIDIARNAVREALIPTIDQTRTTGLVVLPGAFVGAVFAGASPIEAGRFQLVVLAGILSAGALVAVGLSESMSRSKTVPTR